MGEAVGVVRVRGAIGVGGEEKKCRGGGEWTVFIPFDLPSGVREDCTGRSGQPYCKGRPPTFSTATLLASSGCCPFVCLRASEV